MIAALLVQWPFVFAPLPEKPPITVALVVEPPPPEPPPPQAKPTPEQPPAMERHSGADQQTSAPPQAETKAPAAAPKPAEEEPHPEDQTAEFPALKFRRPAPSQTVRPAVKEAERETAPEPVTRSALHVAIGELKDGDPYLNALTAMIEQHRFYPPDAVGAFGKRLTGIVVYRVALSAGGGLEAIQLKTSSGSDALDEAASTMIKRTAPFPPLPSYVNANSMVLEWAIRVFPPGE